MLPAVPGATKYSSPVVQVPVIAAAVAASKAAMAAKPQNPVPAMGYENGSYVRQARYRPGVTVQSKLADSRVGFFRCPRIVMKTSVLCRGESPVAGCCA
jgi:hypothetical protein